MINTFVNIGDNITQPSANRQFLNSSNLIQELAIKQRAFRAAWITDTHFSTAFPYCVAQTPAFKASLLAQEFDVLLHTGDIINDSASYVPLWDAFKVGITQPIVAALGNHDYGATAAQLGLPSRYYTYDMNGWRFIILDSTDNNTHISSPYSLGAVQTAWLVSVLQATPIETHICIMTHVPIMSTAAQMWYNYNLAINPILSTTWNGTKDQHVDTYYLTNLFRSYKNVKVVIDGHEHFYSDDSTLGVRHISGLAVSGDFWQTEIGYMFVPENFRGYMMMNFNTDGTIDYPLEQIDFRA